MDRLKNYFNEYFSDATKPTARNLFLIVVSILALDIFRSVRFAHRHVLSKLSDTSLNAYYYALKTDRLDHESWRDVTLSKALKVVPKQLAVQPLFLSIDDTMVEKEGEKFELRSKLFDHAAHNGSNYLNGHCMVSILLSFPVLADGSIRYISVPLGYRLWDKNRQSWKLLPKWCVMLWTALVQTGRCSCSATAGIRKDALQALWTNMKTLTSYAMPE